MVRDPTSGAAFPGNKIPLSRFSPIGQAMLNLFPLPNTTDPSGARQFNYSDVLSKQYGPAQGQDFACGL